MRASILLLACLLGCARSRTPPPGAATARALRADAHAAQVARDYRRCAELFARASAADPDGATGDDLSQGRCLALAGDRDAAFSRLNRAAVRGFSDPWQLERETDLVSLRDDPLWPVVLGGGGATEAAHDRGADPELRRLHDEDQADRHGGLNAIDWAAVAPRDAARRARVRELLAEGRPRISDDFYHAAMVLQHGDGTEDFRLAHELAVRAVELEPTDDRARWLAAAAKDRELKRSGKPQLYGTQFHKVEGRWEVYATDPTVTDDERARWNVPPLAEAHRRAAEMNAHPPP